MAVAKSHPAAGLLGTTIVVADGGTNGQGNTGDNESYNVTTNQWTTITADPTARYASCYGVIGTQLYDMGGTNSANSSFALAGNKWTTTLAPTPHTGLFPGSAVFGGQLYCMGGWASFGGAVTNNVQIYQP